MPPAEGDGMEIIMHYIISDIHGQITAFKRLLEKIDFDGCRDKMIIAGDIIDRGNYGIELIKFIQPYVEAASMKMLIGNHKKFCLNYIEGKLDDFSYKLYGGAETINSLNKMTAESKNELYLFLKNLPIYEEIRTKYGATVVTHSGFLKNCLIYNNDRTINVIHSIEKAADINLFDFLLSDDIHYMNDSELNSLDKFMIVGHVPVLKLNNDGSNHIHRKSGYICIDTGAPFIEKGGALSCYCVETDEQIYS